MDHRVAARATWPEAGEALPAQEKAWTRIAHALPEDRRAAVDGEVA